MKHSIILFVISAFILCTSNVAQAAQAADIIQKSGITGGLIVHAGCGDGKKTVKFHVSDGFLVHGLDVKQDNVEKARASIRSAGCYGAVSVDLFDGVHLPYVDNMVNLLVVETGSEIAVSDKEIMRVLAPCGNAFIGERRIVKPRPSDIDEWTHYLRDPSNNAVSNDTEVGPPRGIKWQAAPKWPRHHDKMSSVSALVSAGGRIFYIIDEGSTASIYMPSRWALIARDAFNGKLLWKRKIDTWYTRFKGLKDGPADAPRRLVASGDRVYATLTLDGVLSCLDAATGETLRTFEGTDGVEEVLLSEDELFLLIGPHSLGDGGRIFRPVEKRTVASINSRTGKTNWKHADVVGALTMAADGRRVYYFNFDSKKVVSLDRKSGGPCWESGVLPAPARQRSFFGSKLVVHEGVVLLASGEHSGMTKSGGGELRSDTLTALSADTGKTLWTGEHPPSGYSSPEDLFVINGIVWCSGVSNGRLDGTTIGYDLHTGEVKRRFPEDQTNYWFHHRCYSGRATPNYLMTSRTGIEFIDLENQHWDINHWVRGACLYGIMPCNGMIYTPPAPCICYAETYLHSFNAYTAFSQAGGRKETPPAERLEKGPAYGEEIHGRCASDEWPVYRFDNLRSGATNHAVKKLAEPSWTRTIGGKLSSLTVAENKVFVAAIDRHQVLACDAETGETAWTFTAGGRVDSPPTWYEGRVLFGSADGCVYCLRARDGALLWRFLAAPHDLRIVSYEQVESLWPVHGSILVENGVACFVAGRSIFVDGGMRFYRLDAATGKVLSRTILDERNPKTGNDVQELVKWLNMPVGRPDILSCDGERIYMRSQAFDLEGKRLRMGPRRNNQQEGQLQGGPSTHLFCPTGFLDDTWFHRTYWLYGSTWGSGWCGYYVAGKYAPAGKLISFTDDLVFVFGRRPQYYRWTTPLEYRLFASRKLWKKQPATREEKQQEGKKKRNQPTGPIANRNNYKWTTTVPILVRAMTVADTTLFIAGPPDVLEEGKKAMQNPALLRKQEAALRGKEGGVLWAVSTESGEKVWEYSLDAPPVFDGMIAAKGSLFITTCDGKLVRF